MNVLAAGLISLLAVSGGLPEVSWLGSPYPAGTARSLGMGETGFVESSALGALANPAVLGMADEGIRIDMSGSTLFTMEKRTRKVYDSFGSSIGESEYSFDQNLFFEPGGVAVSIRNVGGLPSSFALAAGWRAAGTFHYGWNRTVRDDNYVKTGEEDLEVTGIVSEFVLSTAFMPSDLLCIGLGGGYLTGTRRSDWEKTYVDPTTPDEVQHDRTDFSGMAVRGGLLLAPLERLSVSLTAEKTLSFTASDGSGEVDVSLPLTLLGGAVYVPGNRLRSTFAAGFYWENGNSTEIDGEDAGLDNSWGFHAGVENHLPGGPAVRAGFAFDRSPLARALDRMTFTVGMGFRISSWELDLGAGFSPVRWGQTEIPGLISFPSGDSLWIEENETRIMISIGRIL